jgi:S-formylglutathione hydrolase FrmB
MLADNPLGDSARRPLYVYRSPGVAREEGEPVPSVYVIQGYSGQVDMWLSRSAFEATLVERLDAMFAGGDCPEAIVVFVDAWTSLGGSQFLNSTSTGRYMDYLCDEVVPFVDSRYPTRAGRDHRGLAGKSSGGYGAMVVPMLRPDVFGALASHAGDALFEACYLREFPTIARQLRDHFDGSYEAFLTRVREADHFDWERFGAAFSLYAYAAAYTPDPDRPGEALLPFDVATGRLIDEVWERWLALDPVRMVAGHAEELCGMRRIYLDAGKSDEWFLDLAAQAVSGELAKIGAEHTLELFEGKHGGIAYRYPGAIRELVVALQ